MATSEEIRMAMNSEAVLLGYCSLKKEQEDVILNFITGNDVFAVLPTELGKSLCYACLPGIFDKLYGSTDSVVIVLSPLLAIMKDQVR